MTTSQDNTDNTSADKASSTPTNSPADSAGTSTRKPAPPKKPSPTKTAEKVDQPPLAEPPHNTTDPTSSPDSLPHKASEPPTVLPMFTAETSRQGSSLPTTVVMTTAGIAVLLLLFLIRRLVRR